MLAIVIPFYKIEFFKSTLESLAAQSNTNFKVYIGDDCAAVSPSELIEEFKEKINIVYKRFNFNLGQTSLTKQWSRCIDLTGVEEFIMILGDDDVLSKNYVEEFYKAKKELVNDNISVFRSATQVISSEGNKLGGLRQNKVYEKSIDFFIRKLKGEARSSLSEYIFSRESYSKYGFVDFPLAWHSDDILFMELSDFQNIYTINESVVFIRFSNSSITGSKGNNRIKNKASNRFFNYLLKKHKHRFNSIQQEILIKKLENTVINDKRNFRLLFRLFLTYYHTTNEKRVNVFLKRYFKSFKLCAKE